MREVEVFADVWCPFTHVGLRRFVERRQARGSDLVLRVRAWPLELVNGEPLDPASVAEEVDGIRSAAAPDLFAGFDRSRFPTSTLGALTLTHAAYGAGPDVGEAVALDLRHRLFELGQDVGRDDVLAEVAAGHGVRGPAPPAADREIPEAVERDWAEGRARGVVGSPYFFAPGGEFFCPALDVHRVEGHLRISSDPEEFERFLAACFGDA